MYTNYIFDIYGTLIDIETDETQPLLWEKLAAFYRFKGAHYNPEELRKAFEDKVVKKRESISNTMYPDFKLEEVFKSLYTDLAIEPSEDEVIDTAQFFRVLSTHYVKLYEGVIPFLEALKKAGKKLYVLSNAQRIFTYYEMEQLGILHYFDGIYFSADYGICKPDKQFYNTVLENENLVVEESIMIGNDFICDIKGAYDNNLHSLYIHTNLSPDITSELYSTYTIMDGDVSKMASLCLHPKATEK